MAVGTTTKDPNGPAFEIIADSGQDGCVRRRTLRAIMFADIVGYSAMMQRSELMAFALRSRYRRILEDVLSRYGGEIVHHYGDGTLSVFGSAIDAAHAATQLQIELRSNPEVPVRVGVHMADVVQDCDGVYGDGVNVAARIQSLCTPGGVMLSGLVAYELSNHPGLDSVSLGYFRLKNIEAPVEICAVDNPELATTAQEDVDAPYVPWTDPPRGITAEAAARQSLPFVVTFVSELWSEVRRRKVDRVAVGYLAVTMFILSALDIALKLTGGSEVIWRWVALVATVGFPLALMLSWLFDLSIKVTVDSRAPKGIQPLLQVSVALGGLMTVGLGSWLLGL
jgi:class 3 adenylate cyclase